MTAERKHRARPALFGGMTLAVMILIFWFSAQNGASSRAMSEGFLKTLLGTLAERFLPRLSGKGIDWDIRKYAHMGEYFCLGLSAFLFFSELTRWRGKGRAALLALAWSFLYACSDEVHQLFVPGRAGRLRDVFVDGAGFGAGILLAVLLRWSMEYRQSRKMRT